MALNVACTAKNEYISQCFFLFSNINIQTALYEDTLLYMQDEDIKSCFVRNLTNLIEFLRKTKIWQRGM